LIEIKRGLIRKKGRAVKKREIARMMTWEGIPRVR